jgi:beta-lactamase class C
LPEQNLGVVVLWNSESALPSGLLPTILDNALALDNATWVDKKVLAVADTLLDGEHHARSPAGSSSAASKASPP